MVPLDVSGSHRNHRARDRGRRDTTNARKSCLWSTAHEEANGEEVAVAFGVSILAIRFLMGYIRKHDFTAFGWYRIGLGLLVLLYFYVIR